MLGKVLEGPVIPEASGTFKKGDAIEIFFWNFVLCFENVICFS
jgi:hypothetical protein